MAAGRMEFGFEFSGRRSADDRPRDEQPMCILVLADLGGGKRADFETRRPLAADVDSLDRVFARIAPQCALAIDDGQGAVQALTFDFTAIEDFHPDRLYRGSAFASMRALRKELADPVQAARVAAALGMTSPPPAGTPPAEDEAEVMTRLLGRAPSAPPPRTAAQSIVAQLARDVAAAHLAPQPSADAAPVAAELDRLIARRMAAVLHDPTFQSLEATWRGVQRLVAGLDLGDTLQLHLLDVSRHELQADVMDHAADLSRSRLCEILCGDEARPPEGVPWSLVVCDFAFGPGLDDVILLAGLGALGAAAGAPVLAAASLDVLGCAGPQDLTRPENWLPLAGEDAARWSKLRQSSGAKWLGLALPRILGRLPYGARSEPVESFAFEEMEGAPRHGDFLWASPAWSLALLVGQAFQDEGWSLNVDSHLDVFDLPSHVFRDDQGAAQQQPCAEVVMSEAAGEAVLERGIMPLLSYRNRDAARLLRWQSLADPAARLGRF